MLTIWRSEGLGINVYQCSFSIRLLQGKYLDIQYQIFKIIVKRTDVLHNCSKKKDYGKSFGMIGKCAYLLYQYYVTWSVYSFIITVMPAFVFFICQLYWLVILSYLRCLIGTRIALWGQICQVFGAVFRLVVEALAIGWKGGDLSSGRLLHIMIKVSGWWGHNVSMLKWKISYIKLGHASNWATHQIDPCIKQV